MMSLQDTKPFSMIHYLAGFYSGQESSTSYKVYKILTDVLIFIILNATIYQLLTSPSENKDSLSVSCLVCIAYSLALYYSFCFYINYHKILQLFSLFDTIRMSLTEITDESSVMTSFHNDVKRYNINVYFGLFASFMSAFLFSAQPLLRSAAFFGMDGSKRPQIDIWCPFNFQTSYVFEATVVLQFLTVFWVALRFFANDSFFIFLMKVNISFFRQLIKSGVNVIKIDSDLRVQRRQIRTCRAGHNNLNLHLLQPIFEDETFDEDMKVQGFLEKQTEVHIEMNKQTERNLIMFIKNHILILRCASETCQAYGPVMLFYLLSLMGFVSVGAFGVLHTKGLEGIQPLAVSFFSMANLLSLYLMCKTGDELTQLSGEVAEEILGSSWYVCSKKFRTSLVLLVQRVNTTVQPCVIGVPSMPLSCSTFAWLIEKLVSLYLFLVHIQSAKKV